MKRSRPGYGEQSLVHFVQSGSGSGSIKQALVALGRNEPVLFLGDDLGLGPINPPDPLRRARWFRELFGCALCTGAHAQRFWDAASSRSITPVIWLSRRSAAQYACLLELVWRRRDAPLVIDIADMTIVSHLGYDMTGSIGFVRPEVMVERQFLECAHRLTNAEVDRYRTEWHWLRATNSDLRILSERGLVSAELDHFDPVILSIVTPDWQRGGLVLGSTLVRPEISGAFEQAGDLLVWGRIQRLVVAGQIEADGDVTNAQGCFLRRSSGRRRRARR